MEDYSAYVPNVHFEQIPIKDLVSNQDYQRSLSLRHVKKASDHFDIYQINPVKVSRRNGINYVFNGQHTVEIVAKVSGSRDTPVWCMIYDDLEYDHEADIFANQMKYVKPLLPYEIFMANVEAGNVEQLLIKQLVESYNMTITPGAVPGGICAISTLQSIYSKYGLQMLDQVLRLCVNTWEGVPQSFSSGILKGIAKLIDAYGEDLKEDAFIDRLSRVSPKEIIRTAKERRAGSIGYAEAMLIFYNKKTRNTLQWEKLYAHKKKASAWVPISELEEDAVDNDIQSETEEE
jgi:hypothetical protein